MALIKTTLIGAQRRVITKVTNGQRRVSCSCCENESLCCMYSAEGLSEELYSQDDLPNSVIITLNESRVANRDGAQFVYGEFFGTEIRLGVVEGVWRFIPSPDVLQEYQSSCLIDNVAGFTVEDNFADTYTVEFLDSKEVVVVRESLCLWSGAASIGGFEYEATLVYNDQTYQWQAGFSTIDITSGFNVKDGNQSTPIGTYSGANTITVSP